MYFGKYLSVPDIVLDPFSLTHFWITAGDILSQENLLENTAVMGIA